MKLIIYKNRKLYKEVDLVKSNNRYIYEWFEVEKGAYAFSVDMDGKMYAVTYSHTAPFVKTFTTYLDDKEDPKDITGFQDGIDIVVEIDSETLTLSLTKTKFLRIDCPYENAQIAGSFNGWKPEDVTIKDGKAILNVRDGYFEYKYVVNGEFETGENRLMVSGESGKNYPKGYLGDGIFVKEAINQNINKISDREYEFTLRTQMNDVERAFISVSDYDEEEGEVKVFELEKHPSPTNEFYYFKRRISFKTPKKSFTIMYILEDGGKKLYYNSKDFAKKSDDIERLTIDKSLNLEIFYIPDWTKEAIWYNIFPDRFYNANHYNDPLFNEMGPENFVINPLDEYKFIDKEMWGNKEGQKKFDRNKWTSDFSDRTDWEIEYEKDKDYSLKYARMYGGDLQGIKEKIPYLRDLGINAVWLNPVFFSYQNHKYGANDFRHISPDFGTIRTSGSKHNVFVDEGQKTYIDVLGLKAKNNSELKLLEVNLNGPNKGKNGYGETENPDTWVWTESDLIMVDLIKEFHKYDIRVIFDGVFNHSSERHWSFNLAMAEGKTSKYAKWYKFLDFSKHKMVTDEMTKQEVIDTMNWNRQNIDYVGWAGIRTLPEFDSFNIDYKEYIFNIVRKWVKGPDNKVCEDWTKDDGIDGFRLDVPNCLENQDFWIEFREVLKTTKKDTYITGEIWGNGAGDINGGNKFDALMNYEWLKTTIGFFINQSHEYGSAYKLSPSQFLAELREKRTWYPYQALQAMQNLNGSHDTDRLISRIVNDRLGRDLEEGKQLEKGYNSIRPDLASNYHPNTTIDWINSTIKPKDILKLISVFQMTYIGAPMLYYGDELGMWGATDPYCRKPMLWDEYTFDKERNPSKINHGEAYDQEPDLELFSWYKKIINIRKKHPCLVYGKFKELLADDEKEVVSYERYDKSTSIIVVINNSFETQTVNIRTYHKKKEFTGLLTSKKFRTTAEGDLTVTLKPKKAMILRQRKVGIQ